MCLSVTSTGITPTLCKFLKWPLKYLNLPSLPGVPGGPGSPTNRREKILWITEAISIVLVSEHNVMYCQDSRASNSYTNPQNVRIWTRKQLWADDSVTVFHLLRKECTYHSTYGTFWFSIFYEERRMKHRKLLLNCLIVSIPDYTLFYTQKYIC